MKKDEALAIAYRSKTVKKLPFLKDLLPIMLRPTIFLEPDPIEPALLEIGKSRFGGIPDVPSEFIWPHAGTQPLYFLVQINLADLAAIEQNTPLPKSGWLYFFANQQAWKSHDLSSQDVKVIYINTAVEHLERHLQPSSPLFFQLQFHKIYSLPTDTREYPELDRIFNEREKDYCAREREKFEKNYQEQLALYEKIVKEEKIIPLSVKEWNALTSAQRIRRREVEQLYPSSHFVPHYEESFMFTEFAINFESKQCSKEKIKNHFRFLGYPSSCQDYYHEEMEILLNLNVSSSKKAKFPKEWTWWEELLFLTPKRDLKKACFDNIEGEIACM